MLANPDFYNYLYNLNKTKGLSKRIPFIIPRTLLNRGSLNDSYFLIGTNCVDNGMHCQEYLLEG